MAAWYEAHCDLMGQADGFFWYTHAFTSALTLPPARLTNDSQKRHLKDSSPSSNTSNSGRASFVDSTSTALGR